MKYLPLPLLVLLLFSCNPRQQTAWVESGSEITIPEGIRRPKNIILMVGDGMGIAQITAGMYQNGNRLNLEDLPVVGLQKPHSLSNLVTDSAAGATAFSTGEKTNNGWVGMRPDSLPAPTILELLEKQHYETGIVVTSTIVHATPAAFYAHRLKREQYEDIALDLLGADIDFFVGGGKKYFDRRESDGRNLIRELRSAHYRISDYFEQDLDEVVLDYDRNFGYFSADQDPLPASQGRDYLPAATQLALNYLSHQNAPGFFLLVEGSQIDWGGHANDTDYLIREVIDFDQAIGKVLDFARSDGETLVVVTADHETGGFSINAPSDMEQINGSFSTKGHTASLIPVFAFGPGAGLFAGVYDNTELFYKMKALLLVSEPKKLIN